ncbi:hypothetical protein EAH80_28205 [Mycobacterium hodleri]|uniref:Uncharacterized protein n=2 Tax=Mycolicibacterium hodleri TaxID=49897 RepID=A0A502DU70_9MYCO|nr:hypothetical protein EAH80_28205 [Mycolicibacterium hodleri]
MSSGVTAVGSAKYIGRVGALALALGVGAAVAGGAGVANAEGSADNGTAGSAGAVSSAAPDADKGVTADVATDGSPGVKSRKPGLLGVPKMVLGVNGTLTVRGPDDASAGVASRVLRQKTALEVDRATGASSPTRARRAPTGSNRTHVSAAARTMPAPDDLPTATGGGNELVGVQSVPATDAPLRQQPRTVAATGLVHGLSLVAPTRAAGTRDTPRLANPVATVVSSFLSALGVAPTAGTGGSPAAPMPMVLGALQLISREIERLAAHLASPTASFASAQTLANVDPANATEAPNPADEAQTDYGKIGKWMLESNGQISDYGGQLYDGKTLLEPINVIIVDPTSKTKAAATRKLNAAMSWSGFPARPIHSNGFRGKIDDVTYGQLPKGFLQGFSDNSFLVTNDHGRVFGPDPVETSTGYVWSASFSTEDFGTYDSHPAHLYVSSDMARTALATKLVLSGRATVVGMVPLDNAYNTDTTTTGDHDGYAVVLQLK